MIIRLLITSKINSKLTLPEIGNFKGLLSPNKTINFVLTDDEFLRVVSTLEEQIKKNRKQQLVSMPIAITMNDWLKWKKGESIEY